MIILFLRDKYNNIVGSLEKTLRPAHELNFLKAQLIDRNDGYFDKIEQKNRYSYVIISYFESLYRLHIIILFS